MKQLKLIVYTTLVIMGAYFLGYQVRGTELKHYVTQAYNAGFNSCKLMK